MSKPWFLDIALNAQPTALKGLIDDVLKTSVSSDAPEKVKELTVPDEKYELEKRRSHL
jgi:hypothetical protein